MGHKKHIKFTIIKNLFTLFITSLFATVMLAQAPQKMSYQAVVRNAAGKPGEITEYMISGNSLVPSSGETGFKTFTKK